MAGFSIQVEGIEELQKKMQKLADKGEEVAALSLYEGAGYVADRVSGAVRGIATAKFRYAKGGRTRLPSPEEKAILMQAKTGIAKFRKDGLSVQTSVGMQNSGYGSLNGKTKPVPLIANSINSGTSFMKKQPFFRKAVSASGGAAKVIENGIEKRLEELNIE